MISYWILFLQLFLLTITLVSCFVAKIAPFESNKLVKNGCLIKTKNIVSFENNLSFSTYLMCNIPFYQSNLVLCRALQFQQVMIIYLM